MQFGRATAGAGDGGDALLVGADGTVAEETAAVAHDSVGVLAFFSIRLFVIATSVTMLGRRTVVAV